MAKTVTLKTIYLFALTVFIVLGSLNDAAAQNASPVDIISASAMPSDSAPDNGGATTHPPVRLTPDKSELIRLDSKAASIIVGNPAHLSVLAESAETLVLVPRQPGATYITVLGQNGDVIMARHVIVASPQKKYVRIRKSCAGGAEGCQTTQVYYCPDMCHEINIETGAADPADMPGAEAMANGAQTDPFDPEASEE